MKKHLSLFFLIFLCAMSLAACGKAEDPGSKTEVHSGSETSGPTNNNPSSTVANTGDGKDFPLGLIRISDTGDGKIVFIVDTALIDDDLSGVVQCSINLGEYSVNYNYENETCITCGIFQSYEKDGKHYSKLVINGDNEFKDGKLIITFPADEVYGLSGFSYAGVDGSFYVYRDSDHRINLPFAAADILVNDDTAIAESNLTNDYGIGYKSSSFDLQYFTPATDDYIITAWDNFDSEGNPTQRNALFSFNSTGDCVQFVVRMDIPVDKDLGTIDISDLIGENGYYIDNGAYLDIINDHVCSGKVNVLSSLATGKGVYTAYQTEQGLIEGAKMYCSKPLNSCVMNGTASRSDVKLDVISSYLGEIGVGKDYSVVLSSETMEAFIEERNLIVGGKPVEDSDHNPIMQEYSWPEINYDSYVIAEYGSDGYIIKQYQIYVFENADMVPSWIYRFGFLHYNWEHPENGVLRYSESRSASALPLQFVGDYIDFVGDKINRIEDNILYQEFDISPAEDEESRRQQHKLPILYTTEYFSVPSITERQLETLGLNWEYCTYRAY